MSLYIYTAGSAAGLHTHTQGEGGLKIFRCHQVMFGQLDRLLLKFNTVAIRFQNSVSEKNQNIQFNGMPHHLVAKLNAKLLCFDVTYRSLVHFAQEGCLKYMPQCQKSKQFTTL